MHAIGAAWLITDLTTSALVVSLLSFASAAPTFLLALPAGALADVLDRRRLLIVAQIWMAGVAAVLAAVTFLDFATIPALLLLTFLLGIGTALNMPVWSAVVPELVPREDLPQALVLNGTAFTAAQAIGPAIGGILVAAAGVGAAFLLNAVSYLGQIFVFWRWRRTPDEHRLPAEHVAGAMRAGLRYLRFAPRLQAVLVRAGALIFGMSAMFALLPTIGRNRLDLGPTAYGLLFGALGLGAVAATFIVPRVRDRLSLDLIVGISSLALAALLAGLGVFTDARPIYLLMAIAGIGQMGLMSSFNLAAQNALPAWVRGRGLAVYTLVFQLAIAAGALVWGTLATIASVQVALISAAVVVVASNLLAFRFSLATASEADMTPVQFPEPQISVTPDPDDGPVLVTAEWLIDPGDRPAFATAMRSLRRARRRDGALRYAVWHDLNDSRRVIESYIVQSWGEHLRQRERATEADREPWLRARAFHRGEEGVVVQWHLMLHPERTGSKRSLPEDAD